MAAMVHRAGHSNGNQNAFRLAGAKQNVGDAERLISVFGGGILALYGLSRLSVGGFISAAVGGALIYRGVTGHCSVYGALGLSSAVSHSAAASVPAGQGIRVERSIYVNRPAAELYRFWRDLENLPRFMRHISSIAVEGKRSHWTVKGPAGVSIHWNAEILTDRANEVIAWRSLPGADVDSAGSVHFERGPSSQGTRVVVELKYDPPAGRLGAVFASLLGRNPAKQIEEDLRRFKQWMETGQLPVRFKTGEERITWPED